VPARPPRIALFAIAAVWAAALAGGVLGIASLTRTDASSPSLATVHRAPVTDATRDAVAGRVVTSFGSISPRSVEKLVGPTRAMHLTVPRGLTPVQVSLSVNNLQRHSVVFHRGAFRMVDANGAYPVGWASRIRLLHSLSTRTILLRFSIPPAARLPRLEYRDAATGATTLIDLGSSLHLEKFNPATHKHGG
jgi:hypothetical protein